jgi:hypothetical protein
MSGPDLYRLKKLGTSSKLGVVNDIKEMEREPKVDSENEAENKTQMTVLDLRIRTLSLTLNHISSIPATTTSHREFGNATSF